MRDDDPPWPTRNRMHLLHFGQRAMYAGASGLRKTRRYWPAQVKRTPIQGLGVRAGCWLWSERFMLMRREGLRVWPVGMAQRAGLYIF